MVSEELVELRAHDNCILTQKELGAEFVHENR